MADVDRKEPFTITISSTDYDSYCDIDTANEYFDAQYGSTWGTLSTDVRNQLLVNATRNIEKLEFRGEKEEIDTFDGQNAQPLKFPRYIQMNYRNINYYRPGTYRSYGYQYQLININNDLAHACAEEAMAIYNNGSDTLGAYEDALNNTTSWSIGDVSEQRGAGASSMLGYYQNNSLLSLNAFSFLKKYIVHVSKVV